MRWLLSLCVLVASNSALAWDFFITPTAVAEADYRVVSDEPEGENGFSLARARVGVRVQLLPRLKVWITGEYVSNEHPTLFDAVGQLELGRSWQLRLGFLKVPLFASAYDDEIEYLAIPELSMLTAALWPNHDLGVQVRYAPPHLPIDATIRVGNGSSNVFGTDTRWPALDGRFDLVWGRAHLGGTIAQKYGVRVGVAAEVRNAADRPGVAGETVNGFVFYRPVTVNGFQALAEAHLQLLLGPVQVRAEGGFARESRNVDTDGNPKTPRIGLQPVYTGGASLEVAWMTTGERRVSGSWPGEHARHRYGAFELAGRAERLRIDAGTTDITAGGAWSGSVALRWWYQNYVGLSAAGFVYAFDKAALESPSVRVAGVFLARATLSIH